MLRLALILALLVAIGGLVVSHFVTKPKVDALNEEKNNLVVQLGQTTDEKNRAETEARTQKQIAEKASRELTDTRAQLETASAEATQQRGRAERLQTDLTRVTRERNDAQQVLAQWNALGVQPNQVAQLRTDLEKASEERVTLTEEKRILNRSIDGLKARLARYEDREMPVEMPGLRGQVAAVDPQWKFLVLDVGETQGAKERGIVMVRRGDQLVGKARIITVEPNRSIANVLPKWQQAGVEVQVGDDVLY